MISPSDHKLVENKIGRSPIISSVFRIARQLRIAGISFFLVLVFGTYGFYIIGGSETTLNEAFYMMGITISTVGFEEIIDLDTHPYGRVFTVLLSFTGLGLLTYFMSNLIALFIEGDLRRTIKLNKMQNVIKNLENHYLVCGCGRMGRHVALELYQNGKAFVLIDFNEELLEELALEMPGTHYLVGDGTEDACLIAAGIEKAAGVFVTTGLDNTNLVTCLSARQLNATVKIVSRIMDVRHVRKLKRAGANKVVAPHHIGGLRMASEMLRPTVSGFLEEMMRSKATQRFEEIYVPGKYAGISIGGLTQKELKGVLVIAIQNKDDWSYNPESSQILEGDQHLIILTDPERLMEIDKNFPKV